MRIYEIWTHGANFKIKADEIHFQNEPLIFFLKKKIVGIFKTWDFVIDITNPEDYA